MAEMMRVRVLLFAVLAEAAGRRELELQVPPGTTVAEAAALLLESHPLMAKLPTANILFAVNEKYAEPDTVLKDGDELALIPPVSGGSGAYPDARVAPDLTADPAAAAADGRFVLTTEPLSYEAVVGFLGGPHFGALCTFVGTVRGVTRTEDGLKGTAYLEYEAYPPMAVAEMERIAEDIRRRWPDVEVAMHHRFGRVSIGEAAVIVAAAAPHRDNAFAACRFGIDELKRRCPIWKKEFYTDGTVAWGAPEKD